MLARTNPAQSNLIDELTNADCYGIIDDFVAGARRAVEAGFDALELHYAHTYRYIYQNPLRAGLCRDVYDYPWSSLQMPGIDSLCAYPRSAYIPKDAQEFRSWINELPSSLANELIAKALRRATFQLPRHPTNKGIVKGTEDFFLMR